MVRIFWAECPACGTEFHAHHGELRDTDVELLCPECGEQFLAEESPEIRE